MRLRTIFLLTRCAPTTRKPSMIRSSLRLIVPALFVSLSLAVLPQARAGNGNDEGFVSLFNGENLSGWHGDSVHWSVQDGVIQGRTTPETALKGHNTFLVWDGGQPADFELRAKFKIQGGTRASSTAARSSTPRRSSSAVTRPISTPAAGTPASSTRKKAAVSSPSVARRSRSAPMARRTSSPPSATRRAPLQDQGRRLE